MKTHSDEQKIRAVRAILDMIVDVARGSGPSGAPSGVVYAALSAHGLSLDSYNQMIQVLTQARKLKVESHCLIALD